MKVSSPNILSDGRIDTKFLPVGLTTFTGNNFVANGDTILHVSTVATTINPTRRLEVVGDNGDSYEVAYSSDVQTLLERAVIQKPDVIPYNGTQTYTLTKTPVDIIEVLVLNGTSNLYYLEQDVDYTISGKDITITGVTLSSGMKMKFIYTALG